MQQNLLLSFQDERPVQLLPSEITSNLLKYTVQSFGNHLAVIAEPVDPDVAPAVCEAALFQLLDTEIKAITRFQSTRFVLLPIGTFTMGHLIQAYRSFVPLGGEYDVLANNCAELVFSMMCSLGEKTSGRELQRFLVGNIFFNQDELPNALRLLSESRLAGNVVGIDPTNVQQSNVEQAVEYYLDNYECDTGSNAATVPSPQANNNVSPHGSPTIDLGSSSSSGSTMGIGKKGMGKGEGGGAGMKKGGAMLSSTSSSDKGESGKKSRGGKKKGTNNDGKRQQGMMGGSKEMEQLNQLKIDIYFEPTTNSVKM